MIRHTPYIYTPFYCFFGYHFILIPFFLHLTKNFLPHYQSLTFFLKFFLNLIC